MAKKRLGYEPVAWWLARQQIGLCLRKHYPVTQLPPRLVMLVGKLEAVEGDHPLIMPEAGDAAGKPKSPNVSDL